MDDTIFPSNPQNNQNNNENKPRKEFPFKYIYIALGVIAALAISVILVVALKKNNGNNGNNGNNENYGKAILETTTDTDSSESTSDSTLRNQITADLSFFNLRGPVKSFTLTKTCDDGESYISAISNETYVKTFYFDENGNWTNPISSTKRDSQGRIVSIRTRQSTDEPHINEFAWRGDYVQSWTHGFDVYFESPGGTMSFNYNEKGQCISATDNIGMEWCTLTCSTNFNNQYDEYGNWISRSGIFTGKQTCQFFDNPQTTEPYSGNNFYESRTIEYYK